jgi:hypothetical protein
MQFNWFFGRWFMALYKAIERGFDGIKVREVGEVFEFHGPKGKWMEKVDPAQEPQEVKSAPKLKGKSKVTEEVI